MNLLDSPELKELTEPHKDRKLKSLIRGLDRFVRETYGTYKKAPESISNQRRRWVERLLRLED